MAFNEKGQWVELDPYEEYRHKVTISKENPGAGSIIWTTEYRNRLHDEATYFIMRREGISFSPENFLKTRERLGREIEEAWDAGERGGFLKEKIPPQISNSPFYKHVGD